METINVVWPIGRYEFQDRTIDITREKAEEMIFNTELPIPLTIEFKEHIGEIVHLHLDGDSVCVHCVLDDVYTKGIAPGMRIEEDGAMSFTEFSYVSRALKPKKE